MTEALRVITVANVVALVSLENTPSTLVFLFTSSNKRSRMFVVRILVWWFPRASCTGIGPCEIMG
jgi:hypothetical protein